MSIRQKVGAGCIWSPRCLLAPQQHQPAIFRARAVGYARPTLGELPRGVLVHQMTQVGHSAQGHQSSALGHSEQYEDAHAPQIGIIIYILTNAKRFLCLWRARCKQTSIQEDRQQISERRSNGAKPAKRSKLKEQAAQMRSAKTEINGMRAPTQVRFNHLVALRYAMMGLDAAASHTR